MVAQESNPGAVASGFRYEYAAKFICGSDVPGTSNRLAGVIPGSYTTMVNIHNPHAHDVKIEYSLVLSPTFAQGPVPRVVPKRHMLSLPCVEVLREVGPFIHGAEGFLVIDSTDS